MQPSCFHRFSPLALCAIGLALLHATAPGSAQDIKLNVTYVCNGEREYIESCNIRDTSDTSTCQVAHPDRPQHNGFMAYTSETRGAIKKLLPTCTQPTAQELAKADAFQKKQQEILQQNTLKANPQMAQANGGSAPGQNQPAGNYATPAPPKNAEERAMRRCVSSGRLPASCTGNQLLGAFSSMISSVLPTGNDAASKGRTPGAEMAGVFQGAGGWRLDFIDGGVLVNCNGLSPNQESYSVSFASGHAVLTVATRPRPLVLTVHGDTITGPPGPVTLDGVIAAGYVGGATATGAAYKDSAGNLYDANKNRIAGNANAGYTNFAPKQVTCPAINLSSKGTGVGIQTMQTNLLKNVFGGDTGTPTPAGIRMHGIFAAPTGFSVQFYPESVILGCGPDAARAYPYTVTAEGAGLVVKIEAPDHPLTLAIRPNGSLDPGSAAPYQVHGRIVVGENDDGDFNFAPMELTCNLGALAPSAQIPMQGGSASSLAVASSGVAAPGSTGTGIATPQAPLGNAVLSIVSGLAVQPGTPNALAGHPYILLRQSYADSLAVGGVSIPAGVSPYIYVGQACGNHTPDCAKISAAIQAQAATAARADANGSGTLPGVLPGTYYVMVSTRFNNQPYAWEQSVTLHSGANTLKLDLSNATPIR
jgi:hypothetical protein